MTVIGMGGMKVIGLDLSLTGSGIASSEGWCRRVGREGLTKLGLPDRIDAVRDLAAEIWHIVSDECLPTLAVIEDPAFSTSGGGVLERNALWWKVAEILYDYNIPTAHVKPTGRAKYACGKNAKKSAVVDAVARRFPAYTTGGDDNLCDAIVLAAMGADHLGQPLAILPATHRTALDGVVWPVHIGDQP